MIRPPLDKSRRRLWRFVLLLLLIIPFLPEIVIVTTVTVGHLAGYDQTTGSLPGSEFLTEVISRSLQAAIVLPSLQHGQDVIIGEARVDLIWVCLFYAGVVTWLCLCFFAANRGWASIQSRLLLGIAAATVFASLPYLGPVLATDFLKRTTNCDAIACKPFGKHLKHIDDAILMGWLLKYGVPLAIGIFAIYAVIVVVLGATSRKRARGSSS